MRTVKTGTEAVHSKRFGCIITLIKLGILRFQVAIILLVQNLTCRYHVVITV